MKKIFSFYIIPIIIAFFNILIFLFPQTVVNAARNGLQLWFNNVLPSLLPFLVGTNLLIALGFVSFAGILCAPLMRRLFNLPGCAAFALVMGMSSGYPIGAKITAELRLSGQLKRAEAQRLLSFCNNSGPLFILGAVAINMFSSSRLGYLMLAIHYLSAVTIGIIIGKASKMNEIAVERASLRKALISMKAIRLKNSKSFGEIAADSIRSGLETVAIIGGYVILFSVIADIIKLLSFKNDFLNAIIIGTIEITNGCSALSFNITPLNAAAATAVISWGGLSIHAQTISIISKTDLSIPLYILSKLLHSATAFLYALLLLPVFKRIMEQNDTAEVFANSSSSVTAVDFCFSLLLILTLCIISILYGLRQRRVHR